VKRFLRIDREEFNIRAKNDRRKRVNRLVVVYTDGVYKYVKGFEFPKTDSCDEMNAKIPQIIN